MIVNEITWSTGVKHEIIVGSYTFMDVIECQGAYADMEENGWVKWRPHFNSLQAAMAAITDNIGFWTMSFKIRVGQWTFKDSTVVEVWMMRVEE